MADEAQERVSVIVRFTKHSFAQYPASSVCGLAILVGHGAYTRAETPIGVDQNTAKSALADDQAKSGKALNPAINSSPIVIQTAAADAVSDKGKPVEEVVVTGTLLRGIAPVGANVISMDPIEIKATGALSADDVLNNISQFAEFGDTNARITANNAFVSIDRPNIRNLPGLNTSGGSTTLVFVDGHRLVNSGLTITAPDVNMIPPGILERVEVIPDGGSATYGSDAVGGVINFITKRHFNGEQADVQFGFADNYKSYNVNGTVGRDWGKGSAYVAYAYAENSPVFDYARGYVRQYGRLGTANPSLNCVPGNVTTGSGASPRDLRRAGSCAWDVERLRYQRELKLHRAAGSEFRLRRPFAGSERQFPQARPSRHDRRVTKNS